MKALLILGGDNPGAELIQSCCKDVQLIVCADFGGRWAMEAGIVPHVLLGDMDSLDAHEVDRFHELGVQILQYPYQKDQTDAQLALDYMMERGVKELCILGGVGGRIDHLLGNLILLNRAYTAGCNAWLHSREQTIRAAGPGVVRWDSQVGQTVSIIPFGEKIEVQSSEGLAYPLPKTLSNTETIGISNQATDEVNQIVITAGIALIIQNHQ